MMRGCLGEGDSMIRHAWQCARMEAVESFYSVLNLMSDSGNILNPPTLLFSSVLLSACTTAVWDWFTLTANERWHRPVNQSLLITVCSQSEDHCYRCANVQSMAHWVLHWDFDGSLCGHMCLLCYVCSHQATVHFTSAFMYHSAEGPTDGTVTMDTDTGRGPEKGILGRRMDESRPHSVREMSFHMN